MKRSAWWMASALALTACSVPPPSGDAGGDASTLDGAIGDDAATMPSDVGADAAASTDGGVDAGPPSIVQMVSVEQSTLVLRSDGELLFWGRDVRVPMSMGMAATPRATSLGSARDAAEVALFQSSDPARFLLIRRRDGSLARWNYAMRAAEAFGGLTGVTRIAAGPQFACAVHGGGRVSCWGDNTYGQLGDGTRMARSAPVEVQGLTDAVEVSAGLGTTCARRRDGRVSCWGRGLQGALGDGVSAHESCGMEDCSTRPVTVADLSDTAEISVGLNNACARRSSGQVVCWGWNAFGMLGDGTRTATNRPVAVMGLSDARSIHAMYTHNCAVRASGQAVCWGVVESPTESQVREIAELRGAARMSGHANFACAQTGANAVRCFGANSFGQLGDGTTMSRASAVSVLGL